MQYNKQNVQKLQNQRAQNSMQSRYNAQSQFQQQYPMPSHIQMSQVPYDQASQISKMDMSLSTPQISQQSHLKSSKINTTQATPHQIPTNDSLHAQMIKNDFSLDPSMIQTPQGGQWPQQPQQYYQAPQNPQQLQQNLQQNGWQVQTPVQGMDPSQMSYAKPGAHQMNNYQQMGGQPGGYPQTMAGEDQMNKMLLSGPTQNRSMTDVWALVLFVLNFLCFLSLGIVGFATCNPFDIIDKLNKVKGTSISITFNVAEFFDGMPAAAAAFGITFVVGIALQVILMRFTYCILMSLLALCLILIMAVAIFGFVAKQVFIGVIFAIVFLFYLFFAYKLYKKLPALDQVAKMAYQFTTEMAGQYCLTFTFLSIFLLEFVFFIFGILFLCSKYVGTSSGVDIDPTYKSLAYAFTWNFLWLSNTTMQFYKFCISYMCCQWYFGRANQVTVSECMKLGFKHLGSLAFQSLLVFLLYYVVEMIKNIEKQFSRIALVCISNIIKSCRKPLEKLISSLTTIRIAHSGTNFCESSRDMLKQIIKDPFYFLFVIWGADTVSGLLSFFTFILGFGLGVYILIAMNVGGMAIFFGIIVIYVISSQTTDLFVQNFQMVLYSIGAFYNLCEQLFEKDAQSVKAQKFFTMRDKITAATALTDLKQKDLA